jgi:hypothetical protein
MLYRMFGFQVMSSPQEKAPIKELFREATKVTVGAWAPNSLSVVEYITFSGKLKDNTNFTLSYGDGVARESYGVLEMAGIEMGRIIISGLHLRVARHFLEEARSPVFLRVRVDIGIDDKGLPYVGDIGLSLSSITDGEYLIKGRGNVVRGYVNPDSLDEWFIHPDDKLDYRGHNSEETRRMPTWLEKALKE